MASGLRITSCPTVPMSASGYLDSADSLIDMAMKADSPERESFYTAMSQVNVGSHGPVVSPVQAGGGRRVPRSTLDSSRLP